MAFTAFAVEAYQGAAYAAPALMEDLLAIGVKPEPWSRTFEAMLALDQLIMTVPEDSVYAVEHLFLTPPYAEYFRFAWADSMLVDTWKLQVGSEPEVIAPPPPPPPPPPPASPIEWASGTEQPPAWGGGSTTPYEPGYPSPSPSIPAPPHGTASPEVSRGPSWKTVLIAVTGGLLFFLLVGRKKKQ